MNKLCIVTIFFSLISIGCTEKRVLLSALETSSFKGLPPELFLPQANEKKLIYYFHGEPFTGIAFSMHDEIHLRTEVSFKDGKLDGPWKMYYPNGKLMWVKLFKDGELEGAAKGYYEDGKLGEETIFLNGKPEGVFKSYYQNGKLKEEKNYINGKEEGPWKEYYENGNLEVEGNYKNGKKEGLWKNYFLDGELDMVDNYKDGVRIEIIK